MQILAPDDPNPFRKEIKKYVFSDKENRDILDFIGYKLPELSLNPDQEFV